jgi:hypothetical protein
MSPLLSTVLLASALMTGACAEPGYPGASATGPAGDPPALDTAFLTQEIWDDGRAEVAFYRVERTRGPYGEGEAQSFLVGTYLVKHDFSPARMSKALETDADAAPSFKYAFFYEFESGSYEYKRAWVANAGQSDLRLMKSSFTMFDWCANSYRELAVPASGEASFLYRSDDYGNDSGTFDFVDGAYPVALLPLLVRALDFSVSREVTFHVLLDDGRRVPATARLAEDSRDGTGGSVDREAVVVRYTEPVPSLIGERADLEETWYRAPAGDRLLLGVEGASGAYRMELVESLRSAYWEENLWPRLQQVGERP